MKNGKHHKNRHINTDTYSQHISQHLNRHSNTCTTTKAGTISQHSRQCIPKRWYHQSTIEKQLEIQHQFHHKPTHPAPRVHHKPMHPVPQYTHNAKIQHDTTNATNTASATPPVQMPPALPLPMPRYQHMPPMPSTACRSAAMPRCHQMPQMSTDATNADAAVRSTDNSNSMRLYADF